MYVPLVSPETMAQPNTVVQRWLLTRTKGTNGDRICSSYTCYQTRPHLRSPDSPSATVHRTRTYSSVALPCHAHTQKKLRVLLLPTPHNANCRLCITLCNELHFFSATKIVNVPPDKPALTLQTVSADEVVNYNMLSYPGRFHRQYLGPLAISNPSV